LYASQEVIHISRFSNLNVNIGNYVSFYLIEDYLIVFNIRSNFQTKTTIVMKTVGKDDVIRKRTIYKELFLKKK
jgi:hypothetical protein